MIESRFFAVEGDSKTAVVAGNQEWAWYFKFFAESQTGVGWGLVSNLATGGHTVAACKASIDAQLAALSESPAPECVLINLGANDVQSMPVEATFKSDYLYICDALNTKWGCAVYIMTPWRRDYISECNTLAGWITSGIVDQRAFVYLGPDERGFLENGDDGATYTSDGVHPNTAGRLLTAQEWVAAVL